MARPPYQPTAAERERVALAAGAGVAHRHIAAALGIGRPTLLKHFAAELTAGAARKRMEVLVALHAACLKGRASACVALLAASRRGLPPSRSSEGRLTRTDWGLVRAHGVSWPRKFLPPFRGDADEPVQTVPGRERPEDRTSPPTTNEGLTP